jgi:hypothetical protein
MKHVVNAGLVLAAIILTLLAAEIGLRFFDKFFANTPDDCYEAGPLAALPHVTKANFSKRGYHSNSHRLRDSEIPLEKPDATLRLAVVGNSMTIGHAVEQDCLFTEIMERDLNRRFMGTPHVDVLNAGQQGYSIGHFSPFAREFVYPYQPDFVLYQFCWNDIESSTTMRVRRAPDQLPDSGPKRFLARHSRLFGNMMRMRDMRLFARNILVMYEDSLAVEGFFQDLFAWQEDCRLRGMQFAMAIFPNVLEVQVPERYPDVTEEFLSQKDRLIEVCRHHGLRVIDLTNPFRDNYLQAGKDLYADFGHFNNRGHQLAAQVLEDWMEDNWPEVASPPP